MKLKSRFFFSPDTAVASGNPAADAVADTGTVDFADVPDVEPPDVEVVGGAIAKPPTQKPPEPAKPADKKVDDKKKDEPGKIENLRKRAEDASRLEKELAERDAKIAELQKREDPQVSELRTKLTEYEGREKKWNETQSEYEKRLAVTDPSVTRELQDMATSFREDMTKVYQRVPLLGQHFVNLVAEYESMNPKADDYSDQLKAFEERLSDTFGMNANRAFDAIEKGVEFNRAYRTKHAEISKNAVTLRHQAERKQFETGMSTLNEDLKASMALPEDIEKTDPWNPVRFVNEQLKAIKPEERERLENYVDGMIRSSIIGFTPKTDADFQGMTPEQIAAARAEEGQKRAQAFKQFVRLARPAILQHLLHRTWYEDYVKLQELVKKGQESLPPNPADRVTDPNARESETIDIDSEIDPVTPMSELV